jgi:beta-fructofuranosidase
VPGLFSIGGRYYLIGSIREDGKVHYWYADALLGPYRNFSDNVLLPQGNYAARVLLDEERGLILVWTFFFIGGDIKGDHLLPPPKELRVTMSGALRLVSYRGFDAKVTEVLGPREITPLSSLFDNPDAICNEENGHCLATSHSGLEVFVLQGEHRDYRLSGTLVVERSGKFGLVVHADDEGNAYYLSLDLKKGIAQIRYWATNPQGSFEDAFHYDQLQTANFVPRPGPVAFQLISYGDYIELSLYGDVRLTLADGRLGSGRVGFYVESTELRVGDLVLETLQAPPDRPYEAQTPVTVG